MRSYLVHVTTHGKVSRKTEEQFEGFWTPKGTVGIEELSKLKNQPLTGMVFVSTACHSGVPSFTRRFVKQTGAAYIAPTKGPRFYNAILFAHLFYHNYFIRKDTKGKLKAAFDEYDKIYKNPHKFHLTIPLRTGGHN